MLKVTLNFLIFRAQFLWIIFCTRVMESMFFYTVSSCVFRKFSTIVSGVFSQVLDMCLYMFYTFDAGTFFSFFIEIQLIYNTILVSSVQQIDSAIHVIFFILFCYRLLQDTKYRFLYCSLSKFLLFIFLTYGRVYLLISYS